MVYIEQKGTPVPYMVQRLQAIPQGAILQVEESKDKNAADALKGCSVSVEVAAVRGLKAAIEAQLFFIEGYKAYNGETFLGVVESIEELPQQKIAQVRMSEHLLPIALHPDQIADINRRSKSIYFELPEGYVEAFWSKKENN
ncbi:MAG: hypothetical protein IPL35_04670 [Sphingobacteriales bacterium]|nr:hypothetical protein [Sphingobacteriales bacterium]